MTDFEPGTTVLVRFPFTDLTSTKQRPAVVLSPAAFTRVHGDVVLMALTSRQQENADLRLGRWREAGLPKPTWFKPLVGTIFADLVVRQLGHLAPDDARRVPEVLHLLLAPAFLSGPD